MMIDIERLRDDLKDNYGTAAFNGFPAAIIDLERIDRMTDKEVYETALDSGIQIDKYIQD